MVKAVADMPANFDDYLENQYRDLRPEMLRSSCYHFVSAHNQNRDELEIDFTIRVSDDVLNFRVFMITKTSGSTGGLEDNLFAAYRVIL